MKHIVGFFLLTAASLCAGRGIVLQGYAPALMTQISEADKTINTLFRLRRFRSSAIPLEIIGKYHAKPKIEVLRRKMYLTLDLSRPVFDGGTNSQALFSALFLSSGTNNVFAGAEKVLPSWMCAAISSKIAANTSTERYLHGLHHLPVVQALYGAGRLPELLRLPELSPELPPELFSWYSEFARVILEAAADEKLLRDYASELFKTQKYHIPAQTLLQRLSGILTEKDELGRINAVEKTLWNSYKPEPASRKRRMITEMLKWSMPELDEEGKPTEKKISCSLLELHSRLKNRPDAAEQRKKAAARAGILCAGCVYRESELFNTFAILLFNRPRDIEEREKRIKKILAQAQEALVRREKTEEYLMRIEQEHIPVFKSMKNVLAISRKQDTASPAQKKFLLETEKTYGD